ncbi:hypothetical protein [Candidatus Liberibacter brunswickensis]|uniref:hypothetical protein n=1 Tax=Candidatus Liberibacter brunswickensis TaxID=1968796 RepID=UPI002FE3CF23
MDSPEDSKTNKNKRSVKKTIPLESDFLYIKNDLRDIKIDIREFRADIYSELHEASSVYTLLKNGNIRAFSSIQMLRDLIEDSIEHNNNKIEEIKKRIHKTQFILISSMIIIILINLIILIK